MNDRCSAMTTEGSRCRMEGPADSAGLHWCHKHTQDPEQADRQRQARLARDRVRRQLRRQEREEP